MNEKNLLLLCIPVYVFLHNLIVLIYITAKCFCIDFWGPGTEIV